MWLWCIKHGIVGSNPGSQYRVLRNPCLCEINFEISQGKETVQENIVRNPVQIYEEIQWSNYVNYNPNPHEIRPAPENINDGMINICQTTKLLFQSTEPFTRPTFVHITYSRAKINFTQPTTKTEQKLSQKLHFFVYAWPTVQLLFFLISTHTSTSKTNNLNDIFFHKVLYSLFVWWVD